MTHQLFSVLLQLLLLTFAAKSTNAIRLLKNSLLLGVADPSRLLYDGQSLNPRPFYKKGAGKATNLPGNVFSFGQDGIQKQQQKELNAIKRVVEYLEREEKQEVEEKPLKTHFKLDMSGKVFEIRADRIQKPGAKPLRAKKVGRSSWGRKFGPFYSGFETADGGYSLGLSEPREVETIVELHGIQWIDGRAEDADYNSPTDVYLTSVLFLFAVVLSVSLALALPIEWSVNSRRHLCPDKRRGSVDEDFVDSTRALIPKSPPKISRWLVRGRKLRQTRVEEVQGDSLV